MHPSLWIPLNLPRKSAGRGTVADVAALKKRSTSTLVLAIVTVQNRLNRSSSACMWSATSVAFIEEQWHLVGDNHRMSRLLKRWTQAPMSSSGTSHSSVSRERYSSISLPNAWQNSSWRVNSLTLLYIRVKSQRCQGTSNTQELSPC